MIWKMPTVSEKTKLHRATIYAMIKRGEFPKPIKLTGRRASGWDSGEVLNWIESRKAARS